jgi:hypothetical protein
MAHCWVLRQQDRAPPLGAGCGAVCFGFPGMPKAGRGKDAAGAGCDGVVV